jgi:prolyl-tRNA editing enzyme YbaK/EbsC (Cys-tRNA(Pro) deacylase)
MKPIRVLHDLLKQEFPNTVKDEVLCTCGAGNHVRVLFFRIDHEPAAVILPEGADLDPADFAEAVGGHVERLEAGELERSLSDSRPGYAMPSEGPFAGAVYLDESLLTWKELVFCPRMFNGMRGECFRAPMQSFLEVTHAIALPLVTGRVPPSDAWAV